MIKNILQNSSNYEQVDKLYYEAELKEINLRVKNNALKNLGGINGTYYQTLYRRHEGVRNQMSADISLDLGTIVPSKGSWDALVKSKNGKWLQEEQVSTEEFDNIVLGFNATYKRKNKDSDEGVQINNYNYSEPMKIDLLALERKFGKGSKKIFRLFA